MTDDQAEAIGISALGWICAEDDLLPVFLAASGASIGDLRDQLGAAQGPDAGLLLAVLEFILMRDETVIACAQASGLPNDHIALAHAVLSGAGRMHWT